MNRSLRQALFLITTLTGLSVAIETHSFMKSCLDNDNEAVMKDVNEDPSLLKYVGRKGDTCLRLAAQHQNLDLVEWLIDKGADPNARNTHDEDLLVPIAWFIMHGHYKGVETMLRLGADPNAVFHGLNSTHDKSGEWFTSLDLLEWVLEQPPFDNGFPDHLEGLSELYEQFIHMRDRIRVHGGKEFKYLSGDEL